MVLKADPLEEPELLSFPPTGLTHQFAAWAFEAASEEAKTDSRMKMERAMVALTV